MKNNLAQKIVRGAGHRLIIVVVALLSCQWAGAQTNFFPLLHCKDNTTYTNATIANITPATVDVSWEGSGARMSITNLPDKLQKRYHYNPRKAQKYLAAQAAAKSAEKNHDNKAVAEVAAVQNTLGPAQIIRIIKTLDFPDSLQIEAEGVLVEAYIPNLPPEILTFITKLGQAQADAINFKLNAVQLRAGAKSARVLADGMFGNNSNYDQQNTLATAAEADASAAEVKSAEADALLKKLQAQAKDRTTVIARPTGKMITTTIRQWQFQAMASTEVTDR